MMDLIPDVAVFVRRDLLSLFYCVEQVGVASRHWRHCWYVLSLCFSELLYSVLRVAVLGM